VTGARRRRSSLDAWKIMQDNTQFQSKVTRFNSHHYDAVSDVWQIIYGDNFHAGYFKQPDESFANATNNLTELMAASGNFSEESKVLDVGCGIGGPATFLHEKYGCHVHGITISEKGAQKANESARKKGYDSHLKFSIADAKDNRLPDASFDIVWGMESFHLMEDKAMVFSECYRVLKNGGQLLLCDNLAGERRLSDAEAVAHYKELRLLERVFGKTQTETLRGYELLAGSAGFKNIVSRDINEQTMPPTIKYFQKKVQTQYQELVDRSSKQYIDDFLGMCDAWEQLNKLGVMSYGLLKATKPLAEATRTDDRITIPAEA
jgi:27-O-demethylrifamycin SV methyltransferase